MNIILYGIFNDIKKFKKSILDIYKIGIPINNTYTPCYVKGIYKKIYKKNEICKLSYLTLIYGIMGFIISIILIYNNMSNNNQNIGGKNINNNINNFIYFIPIIFEMSIYFSVHLIYITFLYYCNLFKFINKKERKIICCNDKFILKLIIKNKNDYLHVKNILKKNNVNKIKIL